MFTILVRKALFLSRLVLTMLGVCWAPLWAQNAGFVYVANCGSACVTRPPKIPAKFRPIPSIAELENSFRFLDRHSRQE